MTYRVIVTREGDAWLADVPELEAAHTYSPYGLAKLDTYVREVSLGPDEPVDAMKAFEFEWVLDVRARDLAREFGEDWTLADVAAALNAPVERVTHTPPSIGRRLLRWVTHLWFSWRIRRARSRHDEGDDQVRPAGATAA